ncbi:MAG: autotransporter-associated beta strand repeat-containing protein [Verrucomicrobiota bacterium]
MKQKSLFAARLLPDHIIVRFGSVAAGLLFQVAQAAELAWSTAPMSSFFSNTNWTSGQIPGGSITTPVSGDSLFFGNSTRPTPLNDQVAFTYAGLTFHSDAASFCTLGNSFTLGGGITNNSPSLQTIANSMALPATQTVDTSAGEVRLHGVISGLGFGLTKTGGGMMTLTGANTYTGANTFHAGTVAIGLDSNLGTAAAPVGLNGVTLKVNFGAGFQNTHVMTVNGANSLHINNQGPGAPTFGFNTASTLTGSGPLTVVGNGSLDVSGLNTGILVLNAADVASTYTGSLTMESGGLLEMNNNTALPASVPIILNGNGGLGINSGVTAMASLITVNNSGNILNFGNGNAGVVTGNITLNSDLTIGMRDWYNWATQRAGAIHGEISGTGGMTVISSNSSTALTLPSANTYSGSTSLFNVVLTLSTNTTSSISASSGLTLCNGTLNANYTAGITDKLKNTGKLSMRNNSFLNITGNTSSTTETIGELEIAGGNNTISVITSGSAVTTLAASSLNRVNMGTAVLIGSSFGLQNSSVSKISLTTPPSGPNLVGAGGAPAGTGSTRNLGIVPWLVVNPTAAGTAGREFVTYDSALGSLRALTSGEYDPAGNIAGSSAGNNVKTAAVSESGLTSKTLNALFLAPTAAQTITGTPGSTLTLSSGTLISGVAAGGIGSAAFVSTISGFDALAFGNGEAVIRTAQSGGNIVLNSPISVTAGGGLTKVGPGTVTLGAANTYSGTTSVMQTVLAATVDNVFNGTTGTPVVLCNNATLNIDATTQKITTLTLNGAGGTVSGGGGTLNLGGDVTFDTSLTQPNGGATLSVSNLNLNADRVVTVGDAPTVTGPDMTISSAIANGGASSGLTKDGPGVLALSGANTYDGGTTVNEGTLQIGSGGVIGEITGNVLNNAELRFNRSDAVNFAGSITGSGIIGQYGAGTTTLAGPGISSGKLVIRAGSLVTPSLAGSGSIEMGLTTAAIGLIYAGTGETTARPLNFTGTTGGVTIAQNGSGLLKFSSDAAAVVSGGKVITLTGTGDGEIAGRLSDSNNGVTAISKTGSGSWSLSGSNTNTGSFNVTAGTLNLSGSMGNNTTNAQFRVGTVVGTPAVLNIQPGAAASRHNLFVGDAGSGSGGGAVYQTGGNLLLTQAANNDDCRIGSNATGYGYYKISGGSLVSNDVSVGGSLADTVGVLEVSSTGLVKTNGSITMGRGSLTSSGCFHVTGGSVSAVRIDMNWGTSATAQSVLTLSGGNVDLSGLGSGLNLANSSTVVGVQGVVNLLGGTLTTTMVRCGQAAPSTSVNFNGGTLRALSTNAGATFFNDANVDRVNVFPAGGTIDNNGTAITIGNALVAPASSGVGASSIAVPSGGSGYIGAPVVKFSGGTGSGATGYAILSGGVVTSIAVTNPGTGYTAGDFLTAKFFGGGAVTAATDVTSIAVAVNGSGGMTFQGSGTTSLSGANTYAGHTNITSGTASFLLENPNNDASTVNLSGGGLFGIEFAGSDTVNKLFINGVQQPAGNYTASSPSFTGSGAGILVVMSGPAASGYATWSSDHAGGQAAGLDFDLDGVQNGIEYFLGATGSSFTPAPGIVNGAVTYNNGGNISSSAYGTQFRIQTSPNLTAWTNVLIGDANLLNTTGSVKYTLPAGAGKVFVRLNVTPD